MIAVDRIIKWTTAGAVIGVAAVAAVASYEHAYALIDELALGVIAELTDDSPRDAD